MPLYLGIDTSNYTTSTAVYNSSPRSVFQSKKLLPVKDGELGLRQSDAVFHHVKQFSEVLSSLKLFDDSITAIGVSNAPRRIEGSYMPCFLVGETIAESMAAACGARIYKTSHQAGHILAALYSCGMTKLIYSDKPFLAFHVSGGTTDCLLAVPDKNEVISVKEVSTSLDLKAGQLIDRVGVMLGLKFPCGKSLEALANQSTARFKIKPTLKDGCCCLSGVENKCAKMLSDGASKCDIALFVLKYIEAVIFEMTKYALSVYGDMKVIYAGGVMSDMLIRDKLALSFDAYFAEPEFSCDNAVGTAIYAAVKDGCIL